MKPLVLLMMLFVSACTSGPKDNFCLLSRPFYFTESQYLEMSGAQLRQTLVHNETGAAICGWGETPK